MAQPPPWCTKAIRRVTSGRCEPTGTVVYGTGYVYTPWIGSVWYPRRGLIPWQRSRSTTPTWASRSVSRWAWQRPRGLLPTMAASTTAPATGAVAAPCCGTASANVYGHWGSACIRLRSWYAGGGVAGTRASGSYYNQRTGTTGTYNAGKQYNAYTGNATRAYDRTAPRRRAAAATWPGRATTTRIPASAPTRRAPAPRVRRQFSHAQYRDNRGSGRRRARGADHHLQREDWTDQHLGYRHAEQRPLRGQQRQRLQERRQRRVAATHVQRLAGCLRRQLLGQQRSARRAATEMTARRASRAVSWTASHTAAPADLAVVVSAAVVSAEADSVAGASTEAVGALAAGRLQRLSRRRQRRLWWLRWGRIPWWRRVRGGRR